MKRDEEVLEERGRDRETKRDGRRLMDDNTTQPV